MRNFRAVVLFNLAVAFVSIKGACADKDSLSQIFHKAGSYYEEGKYSEAITQYQAILSRGYESGNIYYNLGNCYYKQGSLAYAILYYEKARRLLPVDADLTANHSYVRSVITQSYQEPQPCFLARIVSKTFGRLNINEKAAFIFISNILVFLILTLRLFFCRFRKYYLPLLFIAGIIGFFVAYSFIEEAARMSKIAVIVDKEAAVNFEPLDTATTHFTIYGGEKVEIISQEKDWYKVKRLDGKAGWVRKESAAII